MGKDTRKLITAKFTELLSEQSLSQISVHDIAEACGVNRNTFYYYFKNIPDMIEAMVRESVDNILESHPPRYGSLEECFVAAIDFARQQKQLIYNIYDSTNRAIFERYLWKVCEYTVTSYLNSLPPATALWPQVPMGAQEQTSIQGAMDEKPRPEDEILIRNFLKYELFGFVIDWINHGMPDDTMDKIRQLSRLVNDSFIRFQQRWTPVRDARQQG